MSKKIALSYSQALFLFILCFSFGFFGGISFCQESVDQVKEGLQMMRSATNQREYSYEAAELFLAGFKRAEGGAAAASFCFPAPCNQSLPEIGDIQDHLTPKQRHEQLRQDFSRQLGVPSYMIGK